MTTVVTDRETFRETAQSATPGARIPVERRCQVTDPFLAYRRARRSVDGFYLETTGGQTGWGYFGVDPIDRVRVNPNAIARPNATAEKMGTEPYHESPSLAALAGLLESETLERGECEVPYPCGAFGWLSYDLARELEALPESAIDDRHLPQLQFGLYDTVAAWEEPREEAVTLKVTACPRVDPAGDRGLPVDAAYERGRLKSRDLARRALDGDPETGPPAVETDHATFESATGGAEYADRVQRAKAYIHDGETFQANISHRLVAPAAVHPVVAFEAVRRVNPAPYSALLEFPGVDLVSASPELLLSIDGDRIATEPIAGTRPREDTPEADEKLETDLLTDEKEAAEHAMLVDLERNDLGKVSEPGSVAVSEYRRVDRYAEVMHLVSLVEGTLHGKASAAEAAAALFPGGTITGAPKPRTMEIIDELESTRRGPYTGSIGMFGFDGNATLNIVIRTLVGYAEEYHLRVGAGIVHDSDPKREYDETLDKARALITAMDQALDRDLVMEVRQ